MYKVSLRTKQFTNGDLRQVVTCRNGLPTEVLGVVELTQMSIVVTYGRWSLCTRSLQYMLQCMHIQYLSFHWIVHTYVKTQIQCATEIYTLAHIPGKFGIDSCFSLKGA